MGRSVAEFDSPFSFVSIRVHSWFKEMTVTLFIPCFVDLMFPRVAISMVQILERLGHKVECPETLACCGQPAFNSGYWDEARSVALPALQRLKNSEAVVIASGSCGAMLKVFYPQLFEKTAHE